MNSPDPSWQKNHAGGNRARGRQPRRIKNQVDSVDAFAARVDEHRADESSDQLHRMSLMCRYCATDATKMVEAARTGRLARCESPGRRSGQ